jgi:cyclopropane-fatty-acyl-phospholipid synthase
LHVHDPAFFRRLVSASDVGAGESYMAGEWSTPDLVTLTRLFLNNEDLFAPHPLVGAVKRLGDRILHAARGNSLRRAPRNIAAHYDLSNELYSLFLDSTMTYSSAYFLSPEDTLHQAQGNKFRTLAEKAGVVEGDHVLEIGCGWGGFAEFAAREYGCRVTGLTLSNAQADSARRRVRHAGLEHLVEIRVQDYRDVRGVYDAVVSIEMLEAVGHEYLGDFFAACDRLLKEDGRAAVQVITLPDQLYESYRRGSDFIRRHIFPGGHLPSLQAMQNAIARHTTLVVQGVENVAAHYAETLRRWRSNFMSRIAEVQELGFDSRFCRMWEFYLASCEAGFAHGKLGTLQIALARPGKGAARELFSSASINGEVSP